MAIRLSAGLLMGILLLALAAPAQAQTGPIVARIAGGSGAQGTATVGVEEGGVTRLVLDVRGLTPAAEYVARVRAGSPGRPSASAAVLGRLTADAQGRGRLEATGARASAAGVDLSLDWLADGDHFVDLHDATGVVASGAIPAAAGPTQLPRAGGPSLTALAGLVWLGALLAAASALRARGRSA